MGKDFPLKGLYFLATMCKLKTLLTSPKVTPQPPTPAPCGKHVVKYKCLGQNHHLANLRGTGLRLFKRFPWNLKAGVSLLAYGEGHKEKVKAHPYCKRARGRDSQAKAESRQRHLPLISWLRTRLAKGAISQGQRPGHHTASQMQAGARNSNALGPGERIMVEMLILAGSMPANPLPTMRKTRT